MSSNTEYKSGVLELNWRVLRGGELTSLRIPRKIVSTNIHIYFNLFKKIEHRILYHYLLVIKT